MAKYSYITDKTHNNRKIQVESAKRDGSGKNIENNYAKKNGYYSSLTAGLSNNFDTKQVMVDESAYNFRPTATMGSVELEVGSPCKVKKIIGGTIVFNQKNNNGNPTSTNNWGANNGTCSYANGKITFDNATGNQKALTYNYNNKSRKKVNNIYLVAFNYSTNHDFQFQCADRNNVSSGDNKRFEVIQKCSGRAYANSLDYFFDYTAGDTDWTLSVWNYQLIDLTQMFGSTIADYIYSLEQANAGSGVAWFKRYFPKEYYAYNSGELVSVKTQGKKITHFNQWDEEWELGSYDVATGSPLSGSDNIRSKSTSYIRVLPNTTYCFFRSGFAGNVLEYDENDNFIKVFPTQTNYNFTTSPNAHHIRFYMGSAYGTTYNHDICINFHYDGERDGEYEPYNSETYACDDVELRGIPQLDENNNLAFEGDEYASDGNVTRKYGTVDLGTLEWVKADWVFYAIVPNMSLTDTNRNKGRICTKYPTDTQEAITQNTMNDKTILRKQGYIYVRDSSYSESTSSQFKSAMSGVYLVYELATPTDENSIPFTEVQECDNWGTEEWLAPTTDTRPCEVPVGHETDYLPDLKAKLEVAPNTPNENGVYVMEHNASGNSYTPIATWLQANGYVNEISANAIKENIGGALRHQLAQANNIDFNNTAWVDLGTLNYTYLDGVFFTNIVGKKLGGGNCICAIYKGGVVAGYGVMQDKTWGVKSTDNNEGIMFKDSSYTSANAFKNAMKGVLLAYEKAS